MLSEKILKKVKNKQTYIATNEDLSKEGYRIMTSNGKKTRWANIEKQREHLQKYYEANKEKYRDRWEKQYYDDVDESRASFRLYYAAHRDEASNYKKKKYWFDHEETLQKRKEYRQNHKESLRKMSEKHYKKYSKEILARNRHYQHTPKGKEAARKSQAKRIQDLGYHLIAEFKRYSNITPIIFHHLDNENVIALPKWIHLKCNHPKRNIHRERVMKYLKHFLSSEYYEVLDQDIFDKYANGNY